MLERKFTAVVGATPKWAELRSDADAEDADSDDEFFRVRELIGKCKWVFVDNLRIF